MYTDICFLLERLDKYIEPYEEFSDNEEDRDFGALDALCQELELAESFFPAKSHLWKSDREVDYKSMEILCWPVSHEEKNTLIQKLQVQDLMTRYTQKELEEFTYEILELFTLTSGYLLYTRLSFNHENRHGGDVSSNGTLYWEMALSCLNNFTKNPEHCSRLVQKLHNMLYCL